jgi:hypothetical protein
MADIRVTPVGQDTQGVTYRTKQVVWVNTLIGYVFYYYDLVVNPNDKGIWYTKTTDGGQTWGAGVKVNTEATGRGEKGLGVWFDQWTPGNTGTKIHIAWDDCTEDGILAKHYIYYRQLDTATDAMGSQILAKQNGNGSGLGGGYTDIVKSRGGTLYIFNEPDQFCLFMSSANNGASWTDRGTIVTGAPIRQIMLGPGNETDTNDCYLLAHTLVIGVWHCGLYHYDAGTDAWEGPTDLGTLYNTYAAQMTFVQNKTTGVVYAFWPDNAGALKGTKIDNYATLTPLTDVVTGVVGYRVQASIDPSGNLYGIWVDSATYRLYYRKSVDGGVTWGATTRLDQDSSTNFPLCAPMAGMNGGRLYVVFQYVSLNAMFGADGGPFEGPDRIYVWLGTVADPLHFELTNPTLPQCLGVRTERGRDEEMGHASAGVAEVVCDNFNGDFSPENAAGTYYGWLQLGAVITVFEIYNGITYKHFKGKIDKIVPEDNPKEQLAYILAVDGMDDLAGTEVDTPLRTNTEAGELVEDVLLAAADGEAQAIDAGSDVLQIGWFHKMNALEAINELEETEAGFFYIDIDGTRTFENRHHRLLGAHLTSQHDFEDSVVNVKYEYSKRDLRNSVRVSGYKYTKEAASHLIWSVWAGGIGCPFIESLGTLELWASMAGPIESFTTPVADTHWNANSAADGTGTDLTADVSLVVTQYGQSLKLVFTSTAAQKAYLVPPISPPGGAPTDQTVLVYGYLYNEAEITVAKTDAASMALYGKRSYEVEAHFKANPNDVTAYANWLVLRYKDPKPTPVGVKLIARTLWPDDTIRIQCLIRKISDRITLKSTKLAFDKDFFIDKVIQDYLFQEGGVVHETTWYVSSAAGSAEGAFWILGVVGFSELGSTTILGF